MRAESLRAKPQSLVPGQAALFMRVAQVQIPIPAKWPEFLTEAELVRAEKRLSSLVPLSLLDLNSGTDTKSCVSLPKPSTPKES